MFRRITGQEKRISTQLLISTIIYYYIKVGNARPVESDWHPIKLTYCLSLPKSPEDEVVDEDEEAKVEEEKDDKPKTRKVSKTIWDWKLVNDSKPIWMRK